MSWDVLILNFHGAPPNDFQSMRDDQVPDPLGPADAVRDSIAKALPDFEWQGTGWAHYRGDGFSIEFNFSDEDPIRSMMLHVRGSGDAVAAIMRFANPNNWSVLDLSTGSFMDPEDPSTEGWEGFQAFREKMRAQLNRDNAQE